MRNLLLGFLAVGCLLVLAIWGLGRGAFGSLDSETLVPAEGPRPVESVDASTERVREAAESVGVQARDRQILFGDLHAHTTISFDAFMLNMPLLGGAGSAPPADACDFARHCAALDFWSINDHASNITEEDWGNTIESIQQCDARAGDPQNPDLVSFLGWEWTQMGLTPDTHYGHKNVVLQHIDDERIPSRPIAASAGGVAANPPPGLARGMLALSGQRMRDLALRWTLLSESEICENAPVRELPPDCREIAKTPAELFGKLDDWGFDSIVIPHGTAWGVYTPPRATWGKQLQGEMHDPERQTLIEVYSGHGESEVHRAWRTFDLDSNGEPMCPEPAENYLPACWRAGQIIERRCLDEGGNTGECAERAAITRANAVRAGVYPHVTVPGVTGAEMGVSGQCLDCDKPAFNYRPGSSAQAIAALGNFDEEGASPRRFRMGFMASSDIHSARPGIGYKEKRELSESPPRVRPEGGSIVGSFLTGEVEEATAKPRTLEEAREKLSGLQLVESERVRSYLYSGGLVAVHADGRDRQAVWDALKRREVYGTSGPRILLWFDLLDEKGPRHMGSEIEMRDAPVFRVRAVGSYEQASGCPESTIAALGPERTNILCAGECYQPTDQRRRITHIDMIRIRPQVHPEEDVEDLIDDPWQRFVCPESRDGCVATFVDPEFAGEGRDAVYYARVFEEPTLAVNGRQPECVQSSEEGCQEVALCQDDGSCLFSYAQRAWSSPIYVDFKKPL